jgi:hypothetical protein
MAIQPNGSLELEGGELKSIYQTIPIIVRLGDMFNECEIKNLTK